MHAQGVKTNALVWHCTQSLFHRAQLHGQISLGAQRKRVNTGEPAHRAADVQRRVDIFTAVAFEHNHVAVAQAQICQRAAKRRQQ